MAKDWVDMELELKRQAGQKKSSVFRFLEENNWNKA